MSSARLLFVAASSVYAYKAQNIWSFFVAHYAYACAVYAYYFLPYVHYVCMLCLLFVAGCVEYVNEANFAISTKAS